MRITTPHEPELTIQGTVEGSPFAKITPRTDEMLVRQGGIGGFLHPTQLIIEGHQVQPQPGPLKVAIIGTAPSSRDLAPYKDLSWEIWGTSPGNVNVLPRVTRWIEIHANLMWPECRVYGEPYLKWLNEQSFPVYMQDQSQVARAITFPKDEMVKKFGPYFFTSTFAWGMALAMDMGATEIGLYGVDMASREEYVLQRPGGYYFIQRAREKGIKVTIPNESDLDQPPPLYGYDQASAFGRKLAARRLEIDQRLASMNAQMQQLQQGIHYLNGAKEDVGYIVDIWGGIGT